MKKGYKISLPPKVSFDVIWEETPNQTNVDVYVTSLKRPGWYTHDWSSDYDTRLYMLEKYQPFKAIMIDSQLVRSWKCENCGGTVLYEGVQLGHKTGWRTELKAAGVLNSGEAKAAYNNLRNLRIECSTCNQSHDWE